MVIRHIAHLLGVTAMPGLLCADRIHRVYAVCVHTDFTRVAAVSAKRATSPPACRQPRDAVCHHRAWEGWYLWSIIIASVSYFCLHVAHYTIFYTKTEGCRFPSGSGINPRRCANPLCSVDGRLHSSVDHGPYVYHSADVCRHGTGMRLLY